MSNPVTRAHITALRNSTSCAACGKPMRDWHNPDHVSDPERRVGRMVNRSRPLTAILAEIETCTPLCRRCHMTEDERLPDLEPPHPHGSHNHKAKLTEQQALDIRARGAARGTRFALAAEYGVSHSTICRIVTRKNWSHIP